MINGRRISYSHNYRRKWSENGNDVMWRLKKGDVIRTDYYVSDGGGYRYHNGNRAGSHSRFDITYEGPRNMPVFSGYPSNSPGRGWHWMLFNRQDWNTPRKYMRAEQHGMVFRKSGWYRVQIYTITHTPNYTSQHNRMLVNGKWKWYGHDTQQYWNRHVQDMTVYMKAGQKVKSMWYSPNSHAYHSGNAQGAHARIQITFLRSGR